MRLSVERMVPTVVFMVFLGLGFLHVSIAQAQIPPNGTLEVGYRQLQDGKLSDSVHVLHLFCSDGRCSLTTLSVNQCYPTAQGEGFYPKVERTSTDEGNLSVSETTLGSLIAEERYSATIFKYRFSYETYDNVNLSKRLGLTTTRYVSRLTGFSGSVVKDSAILGKVVSWELVPLRGAIALVEPKCKMAVFGVP
jgi:hypothetical protein